MKKHPIFIAVLSAFIVLSAFVGCSDQVVFPISVVSAEIVQEKDMLVGQDFDASNFIVRATYNDGSTRDLRGIVDFNGSTVANGSELSANAGRDMYGDDYYVYGYINAYELTGLEVTGPATINTESQNSVTVKPEDLTVTAKYAVKGETRTMTLVPVADFTVSSVSIDDGVTLDTSKTDAAATATVETTFQNESGTVEFAFTAHYTGSAEPVEPSEYVWYNHTLAYSIADGAYFNRGLFGDGTDIVTIYKVLAPEGTSSLGTDYQLEPIEDTDNLTLTLDATFDDTTGDETRFSADAETAAVTVSYRFIENQANKYEYASQIVGSVKDGVLTRGTGISIPLYDDYLKDLTITLADPEKTYYVEDGLTYEDFDVYPVWASGVNADTKLVLSLNYDFNDKTAALDTPITFTYTGDDNAWEDYADGINSKTFEIEVLDYPSAITVSQKEDLIIYTGQTYTTDMFDFDIEWASGVVYEEGEAPAIEISVSDTRSVAGSTAEVVYFDWSCQGKTSADDSIYVEVTPAADYPKTVTTPSTVTGTPNTNYDSSDFEFTVEWMSGLVYGEGGTTTATMPPITYKLSGDNGSSWVDNLSTGPDAATYNIQIKWECNGHESESPMNVTLTVAE